MTTPPGASQFFADMRERHAIYLRRKAGLPPPWTQDPVMRQYSITNPFRENDKTTQHLKRVIREPLRDKPEVLLAIAVYRWFNRIETGDAIFSQTGLYANGSSTAWEEFLRTGDTEILKDTILKYCGTGPYVTGSYIIQGWRGMNKLDGVLKCVENFANNTFAVDLDLNIDTGVEPENRPQAANWRQIAEKLLQTRGKTTLEATWNWLRRVDYLGDFMAHEIVQDLRYTKVLDMAPDINTWSNPGPGAERGLARVFGRDITGNIVRRTPKAQLIQEMRELLELSRSPEYWPQKNRNIPGYHSAYSDGVGFSWESIGTEDFYVQDGAWPVLELHQIEMWLCEYQKIVKARTGEGRPRGKFHGGAGRA